MKTRIFAICLITVALFYGHSFAQQEDHEDFILLGANYLFMDTQQFSDHVEDAELKESMTTFDLNLTWARDYPKGAHVLSTGLRFRMTNLGSFKDHKQLQLSGYQWTGRIGYGYAAASWVTIRATADLGIGLYHYLFMTGTKLSSDVWFNGRVIAFYVPVDLTAGFDFHTSQNTFINLSGGYSIVPFDFGRIYGGDWRKETYSFPNMNHGFVGLGFGFRL